MRHSCRSHVPRVIRLCRYALGLFLLVQAGCSKEKLDEMVTAAKDKASEINQTVQSNPTVADILPASGKAEVQIASGPIRATATYVRLYSIGDGRPNVVQWTSYEPEAGPQTYPALLARGTTAATSLQSLAGQPLATTLYVQSTSTSPVLSNSGTAPVQATVQNYNEQDKTLALQIGPCQLISATGERVDVQSIQMEGVLP